MSAKPSSSSALPGYNEDLPGYKDAISGATNEVLQPTTLVLSNMAIHSQTEPANTLYQVNRSIAGLGPATYEVEFQRIEHTAHGDDDYVDVKKRPRLIYQLRHPKGSATSSSSSKYSSYYAKAVSGKRTGHASLGLKASWLHKMQWTAMPVDTPKDLTEIECPEFTSKAKPAFQVKLNKKDQVYHWTDGAGGKEVAVESDTHKAEPKLGITTAMHRLEVDALVAMWCCRLWHDSAVVQEDKMPVMKGAKDSEVSKMVFY